MVYRESLEKVRDSENLFILSWVFIIGLLSAQRFWFPQTSAFICASLLLVPIIYGIQHKYSFATPIISLIAMNDLGGGAYEETPAILKYVLYINAFYFSFIKRRYQHGKKWIKMLAYTSIVLFNTMFHEHELDGYTFFRDVLTLVIAYCVFSAAPYKNFSPVSFRLILAFSVGVLVSEVINIATSFNISLGDYLNYSSSKYVVVFPLVYYISKNYVLRSIAIFPVVLMIELHYNSRMLTLTSILALGFLLIRNISIKTIKPIVVILILGGLVFGFGESFLETFKANRILASVSDIVGVGQAEDSLDGLDAVRAAETKFFFSQNIYKIVFGNGLGTGMLDSSGLFSVAFDDNTAFSLSERNRSHFFRLHDSWNWFGFRFGLLMYIIILFWSIKGCFNPSAEVALISSLTFLALINSTFSINGLIACGILALYKNNLANTRDPAVTDKKLL